MPQSYRLALIDSAGEVGDGRDTKHADSRVRLHGVGFPETVRDQVIREGLRRHPAPWSSVGSLLLAAMLGFTLGNVFQDEKAYLAAHLTVGVPAWLLLASGLRFWPQPRTDRYSRIARHGLLIAIAVLATGSSFEAVGAIGYEEMLGIPLLAGFHPVGVVIGAAGLALAFFRGRNQCPCMGRGSRGEAAGGMDALREGPGRVRRGRIHCRSFGLRLLISLTGAIVETPSPVVLQWSRGT